jgi:UDP-N-acetylglucosamine 2-epimerase (non-hydrolysing)
MLYNFTTLQNKDNFIIKISVVFGTRPEAIKLAPLISALKKNPRDFEVKVYVTGQHREMLDQVLDVFDVQPNLDFSLMTTNQDLATIFSSVMVAVNNVVIPEKPDLVLVHGDTTTSVACALACFFAEVRVGHVESGLRTYNLKSPFPEELNRQIISKIASLHFAPTKKSRDNLMGEGVPEKSIFVTGNTVIDSLQYIMERIDCDVKLSQNLISELDDILKFSWLNTRYVLVTGHRRESFGKGFEEICRSIKALAQQYPFLHFVYPVHLNPNVLNPVSNYLGGLSNVHLIHPQPYLHFLLLLKHCYFVMSDSGGLQEESPSFRKPLLLLRDTTERPEAIDVGVAIKVGADYERIVSIASRLLEDQEFYLSQITGSNPFGDGKAVDRIIHHIRNYFIINPKTLTAGKSS